MSECEYAESIPAPRCVLADRLEQALRHKETAHKELQKERERLAEAERLLREWLPAIEEVFTDTDDVRRFLGLLPTDSAATGTVAPEDVEPVTTDDDAPEALARAAAAIDYARRAAPASASRIIPPPPVSAEEMARPFGPADGSGVWKHPPANAEPTDADLLDMGYAPGGYVGRCDDCREQTWDLDKRARVCRPCAVKRWQRRAVQPSVDPLNYLERVPCVQCGELRKRHPNAKCATWVGASADARPTGGAHDNNTDVIVQTVHPSLSPTHYCVDCGALWRQCDDFSMNLRSASCCDACNNAPVGPQIRPLYVAPTTADQPAAAPASVARIAITTKNVADYFDGVMIEVRDFPSGTHGVPGWKCKACGWTVGTVGLPPPHDCPRPADQPGERHGN